MKIRCFKHRGPLTRIEQICLSSFAAHHEEVQLLSYAPIDNLPAGVRNVDANEILPTSSEMYRRNSGDGVYAMIRWKTLLMHGGCFITSDVLCIRPFDFAEPVVFGRKSDVDGFQWGIEVLIFPPEHEACRYMLDRCLQPHIPVAGEKLRHRLKKEFRRRFTKSVRPVRPWSIGGERGFHSAVEKFQLDSLAQPIPVFFPIHEARWRSPYDDTFRDDYQLLGSTRAIFLNSFHVERNQFDLTKPFLRGSLMDHYERKLLHPSGRLAA